MHCPTSWLAPTAAHPWSLKCLSLHAAELVPTAAAAIPVQPSSSLSAAPNLGQPHLCLCSASWGEWKRKKKWCGEWTHSATGWANLRRGRQQCFVPCHPLSATIESERLALKWVSLFSMALTSRNQVPEGASFPLCTCMTIKITWREPSPLWPFRFVMHSPSRPT